MARDVVVADPGEDGLQDDAEEHLRMRIGAGLVEAAADDDPDDERLIGK